MTSLVIEQIDSERSSSNGSQTPVVTYRCSSRNITKTFMMSDRLLERFEEISKSVTILRWISTPNFKGPEFGQKSGYLSDRIWALEP